MDSDLGSMVLLKRRYYRPLDIDCIAQGLSDASWLGCSATPEPFRSRRVGLRVGAATQVLGTPSGRTALMIRCRDRFYVRRREGRTDGPGKRIVFRALTSIGYTTVVEFQTPEFLSLVGMEVKDYYGFNINLPWSFETCGGQAPNADLVAEDVRAFFRVDSGLRRELQEFFLRARKESARRIEGRQAGLRRRRQVSIQRGGEQTFLGYEPTNETELVILCIKLEEVLSHWLPEFQVVEYTAKDGIDAMIRCRKSDDAPLRDHMVEFEYNADSFFVHRHPIGQVDFIVCWTSGRIREGVHRFGSGGLGAGPLTLNALAMDWRISLQFAEHQIVLLPLRSTPGLRLW